MVSAHQQASPTEQRRGRRAAPSDRGDAAATPARRRRTDHAAGHPSGDERFAIIDKALTRGRYAQDHLIEVLHVAQDVFGYLSPDVLHYLAHELRLPPSMVFGVATFYHLFSFDPPGAHACTVCTGTACFVKGADAIVGSLQQTYSVPAGSTTEDGAFTLSTARCLGSCGMAPVVVVDGVVRGHQSAESALEAVEAALAQGDGERTPSGGDVPSGRDDQRTQEAEA
jgi:bidirectional [NiFe] hydrogenase diaphorase subunit